ncbi:hypothetical protein K438DRAFT_74050 [Mycena galopus ATCC 62051]|nr:hypothetical protein K438DRAFT_74050 [Mycena galopus ATCC 62051]
MRSRRLSIFLLLDAYIEGLMLPLAEAMHIPRPLTYLPTGRLPHQASPSSVAGHCDHDVSKSSGDMESHSGETRGVSYPRL